MHLTLKTNQNTKFQQKYPLRALAITRVLLKEPRHTEQKILFLIRKMSKNICLHFTQVHLSRLLV